jgi:hypothetical protein
MTMVEGGTCTATQAHINVKQQPQQQGVPRGLNTALPQALIEPPDHTGPSTGSGMRAPRYTRCVHLSANRHKPTRTPSPAAPTPAAPAHRLHPQQPPVCPGRQPPQRAAGGQVQVAVRPLMAPGPGEGQGSTHSPHQHPATRQAAAGEGVG